MKLILTTIGALLAIAAVLGGLYVSLYLCLFGGIVQVIEGAKATPIQSSEIAFGVLRFIFAGFLGVATFLIGGVISSFFLALGKK